MSLVDGNFVPTTPQLDLGGYSNKTSTSLSQALQQAQSNEAQATTNGALSWGQGTRGTYNAVGQAAAVNSESQYKQQSQDLRNQELYDPWSFYREGATTNLANFAGGADPSNVFRDKLTQMSNGQFSPDDPSYQWRLQQGQQTVERSLGARGLLNSGNAGIELQQYGQGAASQEYAAQYGRMLQGLSGVESQYNSQFSRLAQMAGITLDPSSGAKLDTSTTNAGIQASAQVASASIGQSTGLANNRLAQVENQQQQNLYAQYNQGLGDTLTGRNWQNGGQ